jgi:hypothetical protein
MVAITFISSFVVRSVERGSREVVPDFARERARREP